MQDIESGLYVSLRQEIAKSGEITGKALLGLRGYIHALAQVSYQQTRDIEPMLV